MKCFMALFFFLYSLSSAQAFSEKDQVLQGWTESYSQHIKERVETIHPEFLNFSAQRMKNLCPQWENLEIADRLQFWSTLLWSVSHWESNYVRTAIHQETGMSNDAVTGRTPHSEGLLQVSYGDIKTYAYPESDISWTTDQERAREDYQSRVIAGNPARTIFNVYANFNLGLWIMAKNASTYPNGTLESALLHYWATLNPSKKPYKKVLAGIKSKMPECF